MYLGFGKMKLRPVALDFWYLQHAALGNRLLVGIKIAAFLACSLKKYTFKRGKYGIVLLIDYLFTFINVSLVLRYFQNYRRSYSVSQNSPKGYYPPKSAIAVFWDTIGLHKIPSCWIEPDAARICHLDIQSNRISQLPDDFFVLLVNLEVLDISCNRLTSLPSNALATTRYV